MFDARPRHAGISRRAGPARGSGHQRRQWALARNELALVATLSAAILLGGGGVDEPLLNLAVQICALVALACCRREAAIFVRHAPRGLIAILTATLALPLLQTIPLPPGLWSALPGRELMVEALRLIGRDEVWMPISVFPQRTLLAALAVVPAAAVLVLTWTLAENRRWIAAAALIGLAFINIALGAIQLATSGRSAEIYPGGATDQLYGTFANHNSSGLFLVGGLCLMIGLPDRLFPSAAARGGRILFGFILVVGTVLTQSRSSMLLLAVPACLVGYRLWSSRASARTGSAPRKRSWVPLVLAALFAASLGVMAGNGKVQQALSQFDDLQDGRTAIWEDGLATVQRFWPVGSGMGTFDEVFQLDESLESVSPGRATRAHNDYLELAVEAGVTGLAILAAWISYLAWAAWGQGARGDPLRLGAMAVIAGMALQSLLDYPLRNFGLLCFLACAVGLLCARAATVPTRRAGGLPDERPSPDASEPIVT